MRTRRLLLLALLALPISACAREPEAAPLPAPIAPVEARPEAPPPSAFGNLLQPYTVAPLKEGDDMRVWGHKAAATSDANAEKIKAFCHAYGKKVYLGINRKAPPYSCPKAAPSPF